MVELRHHATFHGDRSNRCSDMAIFRFFQDGGRPPFCICDACVRTTREGHLMVFISAQKFGWNRCNSFDNMDVFDLASLA